MNIDADEGPYLHKDYAVKAAEHLLAYLKSEQDRHVARTRLFETRAQTMATFAGAAGSLAALLKPQQPSGLVTAALICTAFMTLRVIYQAFTVHRNRDSSAGGDKTWALDRAEAIWQHKVSPMDVLHQLHIAYIDNIEAAKHLAEEKARAVSKLQLFFRVQLFFVLSTILLSAL